MSVSASMPHTILPSGTPCWVELPTPDEAAAQYFYRGLFGWDFQSRSDPAAGSYTIASLGGVPTGGLYRNRAGQAPRWTVHLAVQNTTVTAEWVTHLGGRVTLGPVEIPGRGSILHATDPGGTPVVFWHPASTWEFGSGAPGMFAGADLNTDDGAAADHFYCRLFNYGSQQLGGRQSIDYAAWLLNHEPVLYRYVMGPEYGPDIPPHWMVSFEVDPERGTDAAAHDASMLGGAVVTQPFDAPYGRTAILVDPGGAVFSVIDRSTVAGDWGRAEVDDPYDD